MHLTISHATTYTYDTPVKYGLQHLRLTPKNRAFQTVSGWKTEVEGGVIEVTFEDHNANTVQLVRVEEGASALVIHNSGVVNTEDVSGVTGGHKGFAPLWLFQRPTDLTRPGDRIRALVDNCGDGGALEQLHALSTQIIAAVVYDTTVTGSETTAEEAVALGAGVCQDHAQIFITAARLLGHPARYVSGYLMMDDRIEQDATHAWAEAWVEDLGWVGFDISNQIAPDERYVRIATGCDYKEAAPISGMVFGAGKENLSVVVQVQQ